MWKLSKLISEHKSMKAYKKHKPKKEIFESRRKKAWRKNLFLGDGKRPFSPSSDKTSSEFYYFFVLLLRVGCVGERAKVKIDFSELCAFLFRWIFASLGSFNIEIEFFIVALISVWYKSLKIFFVPFINASQNTNSNSLECK